MAVRAYISAALVSFQDRDDVYQQVALTVARRFEEYDKGRPFLGWVLWLAKSRLTDFYRSQQKQPQLLSDEMLDRFADALVKQRDMVNPRQEALDMCLKEMTERSRSLIRLKYNDGLKIDQIAKVIGITPASVRVALYRVREFLATCIRRRIAREGLE
ncbi:MAG: sigma-70 family RNA polymerase sigma factor [Gemmataceae bacterium]